MRPIILFLVPVLAAGSAFGQVSLRDSIFRAQDAYQQGKLMGEGDASGLLGIVGNILPDEGGTFSLPGALLTGAFGILGSAQSARERAKEKMEQEHLMMSQYLDTGMSGYPAPYGFPSGAGSLPYPGTGAAYPGQAGWAPYPQQNVPIRRALPIQQTAAARAVSEKKPAHNREHAAPETKAAPEPSQQDLSELSQSLEESFTSEFDSNYTPATEGAGSLEEALEGAFEPLFVPSDTPKM